VNDDTLTPPSPFPTKPNGSAADNLDSDIQAIRESGLFDEAYYRANNPDLPPSVDAIRHFLEQGAGEGRQPHRDFDPAFYLARYPDVARAEQNPLLHYLSIGVKEGRKPNSKEVGSWVPVTDAEIQCLKQPSFRDEVALFATHSPHGRLKPHVRHYLDSLKRQGIAVILIVNADGSVIAPQQIDKINGIDGMFVRWNEGYGYDFAAWAHILRLHPELFDAKILYLLNDSVIGPTNDAAFAALLTRLRNSTAGLIGLTENFEKGWHIQSYFLALKRPALSSIALRKFISDIVSYNDPEDVIDDFEIRLAPTLRAAGVSCEPMFAASDPRNPTIYHWKHLLLSGVPFIKVKAMDGGIESSDWRELLAAQGYDVSLAERTLAEAKAPLAVPSSPLLGRPVERRSLRSKPALFIEPSRPERITAISRAAQRKPIVLVLGMHRSGTSLCSHILSALGVDMADDIGVDVRNDKGHWERWEIAEFHDRILRLFNRDCGGGFHDFALPVAWWADPHVAQIRREIAAFLEKRMADGYFGFKDPRTMRLMPVWHQILNELNLVPKIVLCLRNPAQIARSLNARDGLDPEIGEYRWLVHMIDFFRYTNKFDFCTVEYEAWFSNPSANIAKLQEFLDLPWQQSEADLALVLSGIIDPAGRHNDADHREACQPLVRTFYKLARNAGQDGGARDQVAHIVSQFVSFQQFQRPLLRAFEDVAKIAAKLPESEEQAAALRTALGERDAIIETAERRASGAEARLADAVAQIEALRGQIAELVSEGDARAEIERETSGLRATLAEREAAFAELSRRADELLAREAALLSAERAGEQRAAAAEAMQSQIAALQEALAKAEGAEQQRAAATEAMQAEITALRERLGQAGREAQHRAATLSGLQAEIAALQGALTAARQVGRAAIAACRIDSAAPMKPDEPRGWRWAVMRFFGARTSF
jgi:hypothetical protein